MAFGIDDALLAGTVGVATGATNGIFGLLGGKETQESSKELAKLQQYYAVQNAYLAHQFEQENLATTGCQQRQLQASAFQFDKQLANYNRKLQALSADEDYSRAIKYIADAQAAYKNALYKNGYNPLLALTSQIPSYSGHTNSAVGGSVGVGSAGSASTSAAPHAAGAASGPDYHLGQAASSGIQSALDFARTVSDVKLNEANIKKAEADTVKSHADAMRSTEEAETVKQHRDPQKAKIESGTTKDYTSAVRDLAAPALSAAGTWWGYNKLRGLYSSFKEGGSVRNLLDKYMKYDLNHGNSAFLGSKLLDLIVPVALGSAAVGGYKIRQKAINSSPSARKMVEHDWTIRKYGRGMY